MEFLIKAFGDVNIGWVVVVIGAMSFLFACYRKVEKYFGDKAIKENEYNERIQKLIEQSEMYPIWHQQSIEIRRDLNTSLKELKDKVNNLQETSNNGIALTWRYRILRFDDEIRHNEKHTKEHFDQVLDDITSYEKYCKENPSFPNNKAVLAIKNIKDTYVSCNDDNSFL